MNKSFGRELRRRRLLKRWTMRDLAQMTGYQYSWIVSLEKRAYPPDSYTLIRALMRCFPDWDIVGEYGQDLEQSKSRKTRVTMAVKPYGNVPKTVQEAQE